MQSSTEETADGNGEPFLAESTKLPPPVLTEQEKAELAAHWARWEKERAEDMKRLGEAIEEAKRRGVPLHYIIPVN
jgi:hypothetical protein